MKLSNLTVQQKFILKLLENESFSIKRRYTKVSMYDKQSMLFNIPILTFNNLVALKKITEIKIDTYK